MGAAAACKVSRRATPASSCEAGRDVAPRAWRVAARSWHDFALHRGRHGGRRSHCAEYDRDRAPGLVAELTTSRRPPGVVEGNGRTQPPKPEPTRRSPMREARRPALRGLPLAWSCAILLPRRAESRDLTGAPVLCRPPPSVQCGALRCWPNTYHLGSATNHNQGTAACRRTRRGRRQRFPPPVPRRQGGQRRPPAAAWSAAIVTTTAGIPVLLVGSQDHTWRATAARGPARDLDHRGPDPP
eukprot:scaffold831_cov336-Prasinococcus_capsulatus_cf.AAC.8